MGTDNIAVWIEYETEKYKCSKCDHHEDILDGKSSYNWCSNCGSAMKFLKTLNGKVFPRW